VVNDGLAANYKFYRDICELYNIVPPFSTINEFKGWFDTSKDFKHNYKRLGIPLNDPKSISYDEYIGRADIPAVKNMGEVIKKLSKDYTLAIVSSNNKQTIKNI